MNKRTAYVIATVFNAGRLPVFPGTWASLFALPVCLALHRFPVIYVSTFIILFAAGVVSAEKVSRSSGEKDPRYVVIDEFACLFLVFFLIPVTPFYVIAGFCIYRFLDIIKPPPASGLEKIKGGWGIMLDDLVVGIYSNIILHAAVLTKNLLFS